MPQARDETRAVTDGSWGRRGIKGRKLRALRGSHKCQWRTRLKTGEHEGSPKEGPGGDHRIWGAEEVWERPSRPASPAPSLTSAYSALLLSSTSANKRARGHVTARPPPSANHRSHYLGRRSCPAPAPQGVARGSRGRGSAMFYNCPMGGALSAKEGRAPGWSQSSAAGRGHVCAGRKVLAPARWRTY